MRARVWAGIVLWLAVGGGCAQQAMDGPSAKPAYVPSLTFDVASIRESPPASSYTLRIVNPAHGSGVNVENFNFPNLLVLGYDVQFDQVFGLPEWAWKKNFNVQAKSDRSVDERLAKLSDRQAWMEKQHMFQVLLADRFQLKIHWETRPSKIYELVVAKGGPKLHAGGSMPPSADERKYFGGEELPPIYQRGDGVRGYEYFGHGCSVAKLAEELTSQMGLPVIDKTGLTGKYDFLLQYHGRVPGDANDDAAVWPALSTAVPDQLGLKMVPAKGERQFLVVDHVALPSEN
jgi:uncharacterized protein (TIGR03435 family)